MASVVFVLASTGFASGALRQTGGVTERKMNWEKVMAFTLLEPSGNDLFMMSGGWRGSTLYRNYSQILVHCFRVYIVTCGLSETTRLKVARSLLLASRPEENFIKGLITLGFLS